MTSFTGEEHHTGCYSPEPKRQPFGAILELGHDPRLVLSASTLLEGAGTLKLRAKWNVWPENLV